MTSRSDPTDEATEFLLTHCRCASRCYDGQVPVTVIDEDTGEKADEDWITCTSCDGSGVDPAAREAFDRVLKAKTGAFVEALTMAADALRWWATSRHGQKWFCDGREQDPNGTHAALAVVERALSTYDKEKANDRG